MSVPSVVSRSYRPKVNWNSLLNGPDLVRVKVDDGDLVDRGLPAEAHPLTVQPGESSTTSLREMVVYVTPVNDQPVLTLPGTEHHPITTQPDFLSTVVINVATITLDEDTDRFVEGVTVRDIDVHEAPDTVVEVSLYCSHGAITLTEGIRAPVYSFIAGTGFQDQAVVFRSTVPNANLALKGLSYRGKLDYFGPDELVVTVSDLGNVGAPPQTGMSPVLAHSLTLPLIIEPVNDAPIVVLPDPHLTAFEDDQLTVLGVRLIDVDSADANVTVTVEVGLGTFTLTRAVEDIMFTEGDGELDRRVVFTAPLEAANRALDKAVYRPQHDWNSLFRASDWVRISITDNGASGAPPPRGGATLSHSDTFFVAVIPENDPPVWTVPNGTIDYVYDELYEVVHVSTIVVDEDTPLDLQGVSLADVDANEGFGSTLDVSITTEHGQLFLRSLEGLTMLDGSVGHGDPVLRFRATLANINHALRDLRYVAQLNYHGPDSILFHASDRGFTGSGNSLSDDVVIPLVIEPVNDRPLWVVPTQAFIVQEEEGTFIEGLSIADVDDYGGTMTVSLTVVQGVLTIPRPDANVTFLVGDGDRNTDIVITGPKVALNEALSGLSYRPNEHWNTVLNNRDSVTMVVRDHGNTGSGGELDNTHVLFIDRVTGVNDAPVIHAPGEVRITDPCEHSPTANRHLRCGTLIQVDSWTVEEDEELAIEGVYVEDLDLEETFGAQIDVAVSCYFGTLTLFSEHGLTFLRGNGTSDRVVQFLATLPNANYALRQIRYTGLTDYYGPDNVTITVNDQGYTGTGGNLWDEVTIPINVTAVND